MYHTKRRLANAIKETCYKNLKRPRNFGDIGSFNDIGPGKNLPQNCEIA
jgi:hypothetical protein